MQIELTTEDVLSLVSALNVSESLTRREFIKSNDRVVRRNYKLKHERLIKLRDRLFKAVEVNLNT